MKRVAPNLNFFLYRPALAAPPMCSFLECEKITLKQLLDMHEALDFRAAAADKLARSRKPHSGHRR